MFKTKRKRAVVLALIAFFCTAATTYVAVDWKRFGGGFLAYLRGKGDPATALRGTGSSSQRVAQLGSGEASHPPSPALRRLAVATSHKPAYGAGQGGGHKSEEDLFKYGDPAAGGIPPGSFIVAQNDTPGGGGNGGGNAAPAPGPAAPEVTSPAPGPEGGGAGGAGAPAGSNGNPGDTGLPNHGGTATGGTPTPPTPTPPVSPPPPISPPPPVTPAPPVESPPANPPVTDPIQAGGGTDTGPGGTTPTPPPPISAPVSPVPEASSVSMMALGALFLAVAASRRRKTD